MAKAVVSDGFHLDWRAAGQYGIGVNDQWPGDLEAAEDEIAAQVAQDVDPLGPWR